MSALTTRILVLGVVRIFGPANGYQLRRELLSWEVEQWAHLNPGSIYSMLTSLERDGWVERHDLVVGEGARPVAVYVTTPQGVAEHERLVLEAIESVPDPGDPLPIRVAVTFAPFLSRERYLQALDRRIAAFGLALEAIRAQQEQLAGDRAVPPHVLAELGLELALVRAQRAWLVEHAADVRAGAMRFAVDGVIEDWGFEPHPDDPGWDMRAESAEYARRLRRRNSG